MPQHAELGLLDLSNRVDICASLRGQFHLFHREAASQVKVYGCILVLSNVVSMLVLACVCSCVYVTDDDEFFFLFAHTSPVAGFKAHT